MQFLTKVLWTLTRGKIVKNLIMASAPHAVSLGRSIHKIHNLRGFPEPVVKDKLILLQRAFPIDPSPSILGTSLQRVKSR